MIVWCGECEEEPVTLPTKVGTDLTRRLDTRPLCISCLAGPGLDTLLTVQGHTWRDSLLGSFMKWQPN